MDSERRCRLASEALTPLAIRAGQILPRIPPPETLLGLAPSHGGSGGIDSRGGGARTLSTSGEQQPTNTPLSGRNGATRTSNHSSSHQPVQHPQPAQAPTTPSVEGSVPVRLTSESRPENGKRPRSPIATQSSMEMTNWIIERMTKSFFDDPMITMVSPLSSESPPKRLSSRLMCDDTRIDEHVSSSSLPELVVEIKENPGILKDDAITPRLPEAAVTTGNKKAVHASYFSNQDHSLGFIDHPSSPRNPARNDDGEAEKPGSPEISEPRALHSKMSDYAAGSSGPGRITSQPSATRPTSEETSPVPRLEESPRTGERGSNIAARNSPESLDGKTVASTSATGSKRKTIEGCENVQPQISVENEMRRSEVNVKDPPKAKRKRSAHAESNHQRAPMLSKPKEPKNSSPATGGEGSGSQLGSERLTTKREKLNSSLSQLESGEHGIEAPQKAKDSVHSSHRPQSLTTASERQKQGTVDRTMSSHGRGSNSLMETDRTKHCESTPGQNEAGENHRPPSASQGKSPKAGAEGRVGRESCSLPNDWYIPNVPCEKLRTDFLRKKELCDRYFKSEDRKLFPELARAAIKKAIEWSARAEADFRSNADRRKNYAEVFAYLDLNFLPKTEVRLTEFGLHDEATWTASVKSTLNARFFLADRTSESKRKRLVQLYTSVQKGEHGDEEGQFSLKLEETIRDYVKAIEHARKFINPDKDCIIS